jgi:cobalt-zinc-cadmium efflux system outer membrane protein
MRFRIAVVVACVAPAAPIAGQVTPMTRAGAVAAALERGARLAVARADTAIAGAQLIGPGAVPNPGLAAIYSESHPNYHFVVDIPIDLPPFRSGRVHPAIVALEAARLRFQFTRGTIGLDADTTYTRTLAAREHLALSRRNALDADSLLHMVERRRDAGDASEMDVDLARVNAGQQENIAAGDSLTLASSLLDLQAVLGMATDHLAVSATDSLTAPPPAPSISESTLTESAALKSLESANLAARHQHRSIFSEPVVSLGFEYRDPDQHGILPTFGLGFALPIFDRNRGAIAQAEAEQVRASAELAFARVEARRQIAQAQRQRENALARADREQRLVVSANRVAAMSLTAYREGAASLPNVLEAQRSAREIVARYIDDLSDAWIATAQLRLLALAPEPTSPR